jgi:hypothetical protein
VWFPVTCALVVLFVGFAEALVCETCDELVCRILDVRFCRVVLARLEAAIVSVVLDIVEAFMSSSARVTSSAVVRTPADVEEALL